MRRLLPFAALLLIAAQPPARPAADAPKPADAEAPEVEARFTDDGTLRVKLLDDKLELVTRHGTLKVAVADVRRIEFATRIPADVADKASAAAARLGSPDFPSREKATAELRALRERAYPALVKAAGSGDPEVVRRAEELLKGLREKVPPERLEPREFDVVHTEDSKITGRLTTETLRVLTTPFGEQRVKLSDVRSLRHGSAEPDVALGPALPAPPNMTQFQNQFGTEHRFVVTGAAFGNVWGTDVYTLDSTLAAAAIHAGLVQPGQTATVRVRIIASPAQFFGTARNGVATNPYGVYPTGAYEFIKK